MKIGIIGFGRVAKALIKLISDSGKEIEVIFIVKSNGALVDENGLDLKSVIVMENHIYNHPRWSYQVGLEALNRIEVDAVIELTPLERITAEPAYTYIRQALIHHRNVITGNKGPIVRYYKELMELAEKNNVRLGISCCCGGALPSLETGLKGLSGSIIYSMEGILNGTTNYILDEMRIHKLSFEEAVNGAVKAGIAEADPTNDVEGYDTALKMIIITNTLLHTRIYLQDVSIKGISEITREMIEEAEKEGKRYRLIGSMIRDNGKILVEVSPKMVEHTHPFFHTAGGNKALIYHTDLYGDVCISGGESAPEGAAAAIIRDIENLL